MSSDTDEEFFARMADLNEMFAASLPPAFARLTQARAGIDPHAPQRALAREMESVLHTLSGGAATFGFPTLGQHARVLERRLCALDPGDAPAWQAWLAALDTFVAWGERDPKSAYPEDESAI